MLYLFVSKAIIYIPRHTMKIKNNCIQRRWNTRTLKLCDIVFANLIVLCPPVTSGYIVLFCFYICNIWFLFLESRIVSIMLSLRLRIEYLLLSVLFGFNIIILITCVLHLGTIMHDFCDVSQTRFLFFDFDILLVLYDLAVVLL